MKLNQNLPVSSYSPKALGSNNPLENNFENSLKNITDKTKLKDACAQFEAVFIYQIMEKAREALPKDELFGESQGEDVFKGMLNQELALGMAKSGGLGLGKMLYDQLSKGTKNKE